ncbi:ATP-binding protein [Candidatus Woesearchaeota archaeon]|nr:ATP-binding protein [Candidatus Woesearchaeota archaeon]
MDSNVLLSVLKQWSPWDKQIEIGVKRDRYLELLLPYLERKEVLVLKGVRRSGKSTLIKQIMQSLILSGVHPKQLLYLNLEDYALSGHLHLELFEQVLDTYNNYTKNKKKIYFFIDEIQNIPQWERWIRTKYDLDLTIKFIITGSSASLLSKELSTLLTGRNLSFTIMPLSYAEFCIFKKSENLEEYMTYGGFPEVVLEQDVVKKKKILEQYFNDIINKDIISRYNIQNTTQIIALARYLCSTPGAKVSFNKLSKVFGITDDTIRTYLSYMADAYLLFRVSYFSYSAKIKYDVSKLPKYYICDNGLIHVAREHYSNNLGMLYENTVFLKLLEKSNEIFYWGELHSEVDFILEKSAINVTATDAIPSREKQGLDDFSIKHNGFSLLIIAPSKKKDNIISISEFLKFSV